VGESHQGAYAAAGNVTFNQRVPALRKIDRGHLFCPLVIACVEPFARCHAFRPTGRCVTHPARRLTGACPMLLALAALCFQYRRVAAIRFDMRQAISPIRLRIRCEEGFVPRQRSFV